MATNLRDAGFASWDVPVTVVHLSNQAAYRHGGVTITDWLESAESRDRYRIKSAEYGGFDFEFDNPDTAFAFKMRFA